MRYATVSYLNRDLKARKWHVKVDTDDEVTARYEALSRLRTGAGPEFSHVIGVTVRRPVAFWLCAWATGY